MDKRWTERINDQVELQLIDAPRTGAPDRITAEHWCQIIAIAYSKACFMDEPD